MGLVLDWRKLDETGIGERVWASLIPSDLQTSEIMTLCEFGAKIKIEVTCPSGAFGCLEAQELPDSYI